MNEEELLDLIGQGEDIFYCYCYCFTLMKVYKRRRYDFLFCR